MDRSAPGGRAMAAAAIDPASGRMVFALALIALAGWVDALGLMQWHGLYVSFMSGNTTTLGASPVTGETAEVLAAGRAVLAFVAGVVTGELVAPGVGHWRGAAVVGVEAVLLWCATVSSLFGWGDIATTALTGVAMGVQTAALHKADGTGVALTYVTGTLVNLGRGLAGALRGVSPWRAPAIFAAYWAALLVGAGAGAVVARVAASYAVAVPAAVATFLTLLAGARAWRRAETHGP